MGEGKFCNTKEEEGKFMTREMRKKRKRKLENCIFRSVKCNKMMLTKHLMRKNKISFQRRKRKMYLLVFLLSAPFYFKTFNYSCLYLQSTMSRIFWDKTLQPVD